MWKLRRGKTVPSQLGVNLLLMASKAEQTLLSPFSCGGQTFLAFFKVPDGNHSWAALLSDSLDHYTPTSSGVYILCHLIWWILQHIWNWWPILLAPSLTIKCGIYLMKHFHYLWILFPILYKGQHLFKAASAGKGEQRLCFTRVSTMCVLFMKPAGPFACTWLMNDKSKLLRVVILICKLFS